jgi:hypothetical protein
MTDSIFVPRPADVPTAKVTGTVIRKTDGAVVIRYVGEWRAFHNRDGDPKFPIRGSATGEGIGIYDPATKQMQSLIWLLRGTYKNTMATPLDTAAIIEWQAEGTPPSFARSR